MKRIFLPFLRMIAHLLWLLLFYFFFRIAFFAFNAVSFPKISTGTLFGLFFKGMRFDISTIFMVNILFMFLILLPVDVLKFRWYNQLLKIVFLIPNAIAFLFEIADWAYFPFNHKRSTAEVLSIISTKSDFFNLLPGFLKNYWYIFLIAAAALFLLVKTYRITELFFQRNAALTKFFEEKPKKFRVAFPLRVFLLLFTATWAVIGIRGGFQYVPISISNIAGMTRSEYIPIILNTPFSLIKSVEKPQLHLVNYMSEQEAIATIHPIKYYASKTDTFRRDNVVFIILESFSKEFTGLAPQGRSYTPFLDSLMKQSLTFTNAYANSLHSAEGVPALLAGVPSLLDEYYSLSPYVNNNVDAVPYLLKKMGYQTAFYHGGTDGTMGFDNFARIAGFDHYYGRKEFNNDKYYDGGWGIFDEPFLQYFAKGLDTLKQPFMASVFTVTSHPPFPMPEKYKGKFSGGKLAIYPDIGYTDMSVRNFFEAVKNKPWFKHTLFVISPDHCSPLASNDYYSTGTGRYQIPIFFYAPGDTTLRGYNHHLIQQIDVLPSVMDYLHYPDSFFCLGNSIFRPNAPRFVINRLDHVYNWMNDGYQTLMMGDSILEAYTFPQDSLRQYNLAPKGFHLNSKSLKLFQAFVQIYNQTMVNNCMTVKRFQHFCHHPLKKAIVANHRKS